MAEVLGIASGAAGLFSLAVQLGDSAIKLRAMCKAYAGAEEAIQLIADEMETLTLLLGQFDTSRPEYDAIGTEAYARCLRTCTRHTESIKKKVDGLERALQQSRRKGRIKLLADKSMLEGLHNQLERAKSSLLLWRLPISMQSSQNDAGRL